jgi:hypothetical protein
MNHQEPYIPLHLHTRVVHEAIQDVVHDVGCRHHVRRHQLLEGHLCRISAEVTSRARQLKQGTSETNL